MQILTYPVVLVVVVALCLCDAETHNITQPKCGGKEKASTLLDVAKDFMKKAKNLYPECINDDLNCGKKEKSLAFLEVAANLISEAKTAFPVCPESKCPDLQCPDLECPEPECPDPECPEPECPEPQKKAMDCFEILQSGKKKSGVYTIWPRSSDSLNKSLTVYCDMDTDGGGWTVIQRRGNYSTPKDYFYKDWESYKTGFGDIKEEFWLGNENIHAISNQTKYTIRFDLKDTAGDTGYAHYDTFWIEDEKSQYILHIGGYSGNAGESMSDHNNMKFTTKDRGNDLKNNGNCAQERRGAWWYFNCANANLNGLNQPGVRDYTGIYWFRFREVVCLAGVEMKLRPQKV